MELAQVAGDQAQEAARARAKGAAVVVMVSVPAPADHVSAQVVAKKYLTNWELPAMSSTVPNVGPS
jgi:hypothetical protein